MQKNFLFIVVTFFTLFLSLIIPSNYVDAASQDKLIVDSANFTTLRLAMKLQMAHQ